MKKTCGRFAYYFSIFMIFLSAAAALFLGVCIVTVNSNNALSSEQMVFFDIDRTENGIVITFMDNEYVIE